MKLSGRWHGVISVGLAAGFVGLYLGGLATVPFHPDESSWIFMSRDFEALFVRQDLAEFAWTPGQPINTDVAYRLLNAPAPKYLIGLGWRLAGRTTADLNGDWDWRAAWTDNVQNHHLPAANVLLAGRAPGAVLAALAAVLMFWIGLEIKGVGVGLMSALLLGFNPLMLLHGRRAMAEGPMVFFSLLAVWAGLRLARACVTAPKLNGRLLGGSALVGVSVGLAVASKQTAIVLLPVALLAGGLALGLRRWQSLLGLWLALLLGSALTFWALNPILYRQPAAVARAMISARAQLAQGQVATVGDLFPEMTTPTPLTRLRAAVLEIYLQPLAAWDVPLYIEQLAPAAQAYLAQPLNALLRQPLVGALLAGLTAAGLGASGLRLWRAFQARRAPAVRAEWVAWLWAAATLSLTLFAIPLDWQRYFLPLVPPGCLFAAFGLDTLIQPVLRRVRVTAQAEA